LLAFTKLKIYEPCWLQIIHAVATLIEVGNEDIFGALDDTKAQCDTPASGMDSNYRDDPVAFFFIIYGICFQTLLRLVNQDDPKAKRTIPVVLDALKKFLRPSISGNAMYKDFVFAETTDLLDRFMLMENSDVQRPIIQIATNLAKNHPNATNSRRDGWVLVRDMTNCAIGFSMAVPSRPKAIISLMGWNNSSISSTF
jgi:hypothetical protein